MVVGTGEEVEGEEAGGEEENGSGKEGEHKSKLRMKSTNNFLLASKHRYLLVTHLKLGALPEKAVTIDCNP